MPQTQDTDDTVVMVGDFAPRTAATHINATRDLPVIPVIAEARRLWPLAPWRWVLLLVGLGLAITCGIPAASPDWNGADLAVLISLAIFVAAFTPWRD